MTWRTAHSSSRTCALYHGTGYLGAEALGVAPGQQECPQYDCTGDMDPMGELFYDHLGLSQGTPVSLSPDIAVGPFNHVQPYLYWSCEAATIQAPAKTMAPPTGFEWSFSFGDGFLGTDVLANDLYVTVMMSVPPSRNRPARR